MLIFIKNNYLQHILLCFCFIASFNTFAYDAEIDGIYYNFSSYGSTASVTNRDGNYNSYSGDVVIPASVTYNGKTYSVTSISSHAFHSCRSLTSITIPSSVTSIESAAFYGCTSLTAVHITDLVAWCNIMFYTGGYTNTTNPLCYAHHLYLNGQEIKDLVIPNNVTSIKDYTFCGCSSLTSITIPSSVTNL